MRYSVESAEKEILSSLNDYWSLFSLTAENETTSFEWARSQLIEVVEALFWQVYENPKKLQSIDAFVLKEWLSRVRTGRDYYTAKEDVLLLLTFALRWSPERLCQSLKISKSAYYFRLFQSIRFKSKVFFKSSGHLDRDCAHFDLRFPESFVKLPIDQARDQNMGLETDFVHQHKKTCLRCREFYEFAKDLAQEVQMEWNLIAPEDVKREAMKLFDEIKSHPIKRNLWVKTPVWIRYALALVTLVAIAMWSLG